MKLFPFKILETNCQIHNGHQKNRFRLFFCLSVCFCLFVFAQRWIVKSDLKDNVYSSNTGYSVWLSGNGYIILLTKCFIECHLICMIPGLPIYSIRIWEWLSYKLHQDSRITWTKLIKPCFLFGNAKNANYPKMES